jgi:Family of unknown function (DUF5947)
MSTPFDVLSRITARRAPEPAGERCEMCSEAIAAEHQHVVNVAGRQLMCVCRGCYLLFTDTGAELRYRSVPDRYLTFPDFAVDRRAWEALQIPVGMAFFFRNSALGRMVAFYPGPAGATESELDLGAWQSITEADPRVALPADDVEALLMRAGDSGVQCYLVPIDTCYEFVGGLRLVWKGYQSLHGGPEVLAFIDAFFDQIAGRAKDVPR